MAMGEGSPQLKRSKQELQKPRQENIVSRVERHPADDDGGERPLHLGAGAGGDRHRQEAECGYRSGRKTARIVCVAPSTTASSSGHPDADLALHLARHDDAVEDRDAGERDETDRGRDAEREAPRRASPSMPPISANGTTAKTAIA